MIEIAVVVLLAGAIWLQSSRIDELNERVKALKHPGFLVLRMDEPRHEEKVPTHHSQWVQTCSACGTRYAPGAMCPNCYRRTL